MDNYNYDGINGLFAFLGGFLIIFLLIVIAIAVLMIVAKVKMYQKAGRKGWEAIVPFYSNWVLVEIAGLNWWWFLLLIAGVFSISYSSGDSSYSTNIFSLVVLFGQFVCYYNISKKLHKDVGFAVLMTIFPYVMIPIIGFSKNYQFDHSVEVSKNGPFGGDTSTNNTNKKFDPTNDNDTNKDLAYCPNCGTKVDKDTKFCGNCGKEL